MVIFFQKQDMTKKILFNFTPILRHITFLQIKRNSQLQGPYINTHIPYMYIMPKDKNNANKLLYTIHNKYIKHIIPKN